MSYSYLENKIKLYHNSGGKQKKSSVPEKTYLDNKNPTKMFCPTKNIEQELSYYLGNIASKHKHSFDKLNN